MHVFQLREERPIYSDAIRRLAQREGRSSGLNANSAGRLGTVNWLLGLTLYRGGVNVWTKTMAPTFSVAVRQLRHPSSWVKRIDLIMANGPSHTSDEREDFFQQLRPRLHVWLTPPALWLNQAESLLRAFTKRYLQGGSWIWPDGPDHPSSCQSN